MAVISRNMLYGKLLFRQVLPGCLLWMNHWTSTLGIFSLIKKKISTFYHSIWPLNFDPYSACLPRKRTLRISVGRSVLPKELTAIYPEVHKTHSCFTNCYIPILLLTQNTILLFIPCLATTSEHFSKFWAMI